MSIIIKDGTGSGTSAKVDSNQRLQTAAITDSQTNHSSDSGDKYNINTGDITLTDATATSVIYVKNNEDRDLTITAFIYNLGTSTGGSGDGLLEVHRNPITGSIISDAVNVDVGTTVLANQNFGSNKALSIDGYKGDTADNDFTSSDGVTVSTRLASPSGRNTIALGAVLLPKGSSIGVTYTPPSGNTSQTVQIALACFLKTSVVQGD
jgi:hypothetical protein